MRTCHVLWDPDGWGTELDLSGICERKQRLPFLARVAPGWDPKVHPIGVVRYPSHRFHTRLTIQYYIDKTLHPHTHTNLVQSALNYIIVIRGHCSPPWYCMPSVVAHLSEAHTYSQSIQPLHFSVHP